MGGGKAHLLERGNRPINASKMASRWGKSARWVQARCREGLIPFAEKPGRTWEISEEAELPPCTGIEAVVILENIIELSSGKNVDPFSSSMQERGPVIITYLCNWGFISKDGKSDDYKSFSVLNRGAQLIAEIRKKPVEEITKRTKIAVDAKIGPVGVSAEHSIEKKVG